MDLFDDFVGPYFTISKRVSQIHGCSENQFSGVVQLAEVGSQNFPPHKQWLGVYKSGTASCLVVGGIPGSLDY